MKAVAFLTTIFPMNEKYLCDFFDSLQAQTDKNFDVVIVNDGYDDFEKFKNKYKDLYIIELKHSETPSKNREYGINYVKTMGYDILIFGDSDDYFEKNRVEKSIELLKVHDIVVNDLSLFNTSGIYNHRYFSHRISNYEIIHSDFILEKNIFGLSNTAIKLDLVDSVDFDSHLIAVDWYFFSLLLLKAKHAVFTNETQTFYRQYGENTIGIGEITVDNVCNIIKIKKIHYLLMKKHHHCYEELYNNVIELDNHKDFSDLSNLSIKNPLWWELNTL